ncbi:hypothetical protein ACMHYJ_10125 [Castellaniella hirudinis]|uniref:hypothetical protein n=1 Tax=Castellaniella hirudinis TaxID=1144617 RepID=UPI0039C27CA2
MAHSLHKTCYATVHGFPLPSNHAAVTMQASLNFEASQALGYDDMMNPTKAHQIATSHQSRSCLLVQPSMPMTAISQRADPECRSVDSNQ